MQQPPAPNPPPSPIHPSNSAGDADPRVYFWGMVNWQGYHWMHWQQASLTRRWTKGEKRKNAATATPPCWLGRPDMRPPCVCVCVCACVCVCSASYACLTCAGQEAVCVIFIVFFQEQTEPIHVPSSTYLHIPIST